MERDIRFIAESEPCAGIEHLPSVGDEAVDADVLDSRSVPEKPRDRVHAGTRPPPNLRLGERLREVVEDPAVELAITSEGSRRRSSRSRPDQGATRLLAQSCRILLKGLAEELELFEVRSDTAPRNVRARDPVFGMEMAPGQVAATLHVSGQEVAFCGERCLRPFLDAPHKHRG